MQSPYVPQGRATRREWLGLAVLALPCLLYSMDLTVLNLAIPQLATDLGPSATQLLWIVDIYGFFVAGALLTMGSLGDRIGRRKLLLIGAAAFGLASVAAAFAPTAEWLIAARAALGLAAATLAPSTLSLIRNMFVDDRERTLAIGIWLASFSAGAVIGPFMGGVMLTYFWWGSVFLLNVPVMVLLLIAGPLLLPEYRDDKPGPIDIASAALSVAAVLCVIWGIKTVAQTGADVSAFGAIALGLGLAVAFVRRQRRLAAPLIDVALFQNVAIGGALAINTLTLFSLFGTFLFVSQYLQLVAGLSAFEAGLWTIPSGAVFVAGSLLTPFAARLISPPKLLATGLAVAAIGYALLTQVRGAESFTLLMTAYLIVCAGLSVIGTLTTDMIVALAPPEQAGAASGLSETSFELGGALGIAVLGSIFAAAYRLSMHGHGFGGGAEDSISAAIEHARTLPPGSAESLVSTARAAFSHAFAVTSAVCAAVAVATAYMALKLLPASGKVTGTP